MGRYVHGTRGFTYKYVYEKQPNNLGDLGEWSGVAQAAGERRSLTTRLFAFEGGDEVPEMEGVDAMSNLIIVYESLCPPFDLQPDVEPAIYEVSDRWPEVIRGIEEYLPGPAIRPDLTGLGGSFVFGRADWAHLAARIGHGADPGEPATLDAAAKVLFEAGTDEYLPLIAANALAYAVRNDIETMELLGDRAGTFTNVWEVAADIAGPFEPDASWDDRAVHARLLTFLDEDPEAVVVILRDLLTERPSALHTARALFAVHVGRDWAAIHAVADTLLSARQDDAVRAELLCWRGDAAWNLRRLDDARRDAAEAADLGRPVLRAAMDQYAPTT